MEKVVDITQKLKQKQRPLPLQEERLEALRRTVNCFLCLFRCSMCGARINQPVENIINLCPSCDSEYKDFLAHKKGEVQVLQSYQDKNWLKLWETWEAFREAIIKYKLSLDTLES